MTNEYLKNIYQQLNHGGYYILGDEFIPDYKNEIEREKRLIVWYSHIIADAIHHHFDYLAREESKTLLDDLQEGRVGRVMKTEEQIELLIEKVPQINKMAIEQNANLDATVNNLLKDLNVGFSNERSNNDTLDLSRHDYKISDTVFRREIKEVGFTVENQHTVGPLDTIGAMCVYTLKKE